MEENKTINQPDNTAVRTALWRALHLLTDSKPYIFEDRIGYELISPGKGWQERPDMKYTKRLRASIVARARFVEEVAIEQLTKGVKQYIILGSGLDSFAQRHTLVNTAIHIYEIDRADTLSWKKEKLIENGYPVCENLHFVPVDFERSSWWTALLNSGFDVRRKAVISCTGVTLYLSREAIIDTLKKVTSLSTGSTIVIAFYLPMAELDEEDRPMQQVAIQGAKDSGTPFVSFFSHEEVIQMADRAGLKEIKIVSAKEITQLYFKDRTDGLIPASGEFFLVAKT